MSNMSYCRFENTMRDLADCEANLTGPKSADESVARLRLIHICADILELVGFTVVAPEEDELKANLDDGDGDSDSDSDD